MLEQYIFNVNEYSIKGHQNYIANDITIEASSLEMKKIRFYFHLNFDFSTHGKLLITSIRISNDSFARDEEANYMYLMGCFGFSDSAQIRNALAELKDELNQPETSFESRGRKKWIEFLSSFKHWFKTRISPCLEKEIELNKLYC